MFGSILLDDDHGVSPMAITRWVARGGDAVTVTYVTGERITYTGERGRALLRVLRASGTPAEKFAP